MRTMKSFEFLAQRVIVGVFFFILFLPIPASAKTERTKPQQDVSSDLYEELETFSRILHQVRQDYVEKVDDRVLIQGAVEGMLSALDPHTQFVPAQAYKELKAETEGKFGGIGLEIAM